MDDDRAQGGGNTNSPSSGSVFHSPEAGAHCVLWFYDTTRAHLMNQDTNATTLEENMMNENPQHLLCIKTPDKESIFVFF